jgi:hypothetical protein
MCSDTFCPCQDGDSCHYFYCDVTQTMGVREAP